MKSRKLRCNRKLKNEQRAKEFHGVKTVIGLQVSRVLSTDQKSNRHVNLKLKWIQVLRTLHMVSAKIRKELWETACKADCTGHEGEECDGHYAFEYGTFGSQINKCHAW